MRARQAPRPDGPCPRGGLQRPQDFEGLCEFFRWHGHGTSLAAFGTIAPLLSYCVSLLLYY